MPAVFPTFSYCDVNCAASGASKHGQIKSFDTAGWVYVPVLLFIPFENTPQPYQQMPMFGIDNHGNFRLVSRLKEYTKEILSFRDCFTLVFLELLRFNESTTSSEKNISCLQCIFKITGIIK